MTLGICILIAVAFIAYLVLAARRAAEPQFAVRGMLTGEKLGYMLSMLAYGAKRTERGNGMRLLSVRKRLYAARAKIGKRHAAGETLETCEQTFFDAFYRIDETLAVLRTARRSFRKLPHVHGVPRLYELCELLVKSAGGAIDRKTVRTAVRGYSEETPLCFAETEVLGNMLRYCLCEYLAIYARKIESMGEWIARGQQDASAGRIDRMYLRYNSYVYGAGLAQNAKIADIRDGDPYDKKESFLRGIAEYNARVSAAVRSLSDLDGFMTDGFACSLSPVYAQLCDGDSAFIRLTAATQRMYLAEIAAQAKKQRAPEKSVASEILYRSARDGKDISFYIVRPPYATRMQWLYAAVTAVSVSALAAAFAFFLPALRWLYAVLALPVFAFAVRFIAQRIAKHTVKRRYLPSYATQALSAQKHATVLLFPCYAADTDDIEQAFRHLETVAAANAEPLFSYCLLLDYPKADGESSPDDDALCAAVRERYEKLGNLRARACVLVRKRKRVQGEDIWQGYEKKRGAVLDFNRYVLTGEGDFMLSLGARPQAKFAVTLDSDTLLSDCISLVGTIAHPYCEQTAVLSVRCKANEKRTPFAALYAGETGPGRYRMQSDSIGNDLFGVGNFTGKGIYKIAAFSERLDGLFPDNRILSHDYIEGAAAGCLDTNICAAEDVPQSFSDSFTREIRWLRGDWQLLPYVLPRVKNKAGERVATPLAPIARCTIAANLAVSLTPVAQMLVLALSLFTGAPLAVWLLAFLPQILRAVFALPSLAYSARQTLYEWIRCVFDVMLLPTTAVYKLCAVCVTLYRLAARRKLLEWRVFAHAKSAVSLLPNAVTAIVFTATAAVFSLTPLYYGLAAVFLAGVPACMLLSRERVVAAPSDALLSRLTDAVKQTFAYFAAQENLYALPCDCYQADNGKGWCTRTSPTNIGMALTAYAAAYELGLIDKARFTAYVGRVITAVETCEKWRGNLYNWYDCKTLAVLPRRFVSTVDSGNFLVALSLLTTYTDGELQARIERLIGQADFLSLFDPARRLLYIGYDEENRSCTENHYDLLGSESTLTYLFACGYGKIPKDAFYNLDRKAVRYGNALTVYSWTGGMFEYLMARLFVAPYKNTLLGQAMEGAVKAHIRYAKKHKSDFMGISECRYGAFDDCGGNLYRAFGVPQIAHAAVPANAPYAPYAAFLAQPYCREKRSVRYINAYTEAGCAGNYGFYDAVQNGVPVKTYMSHHQGMLLAACANAVKRDCLPERLLSLPAWRAARLLCGEERMARARSKKIFPTVGESAPLSDEGAYLCKCARLCVVASKYETRLQYGGKRLLQNVRIMANGAAEPLLGGDFSARESAVWRRSGKDYSCECELCVLPAPLGVVVTVSYRNTAAVRRKVTFTVSADPVLARIEDYESHPAYSRMFVQTGYGDDGRSVWARREGEGVTALLCIPSEGEVRYTADKCALTGRGRATAAPKNGNPVLGATVTRTLRAGQVCTLTCCFLAAETTEQADHAVRLAYSDCAARNAGASAPLARAVSPYARALARQLLSGALGACACEAVAQDKPTVAHEITGKSLARLQSVLSDLRLLYDAGFSFHTVLYCRKHVGTYPARCFDAEHAVELSGIRGSAGGNGTVTVLQCDERAYAALRAHAPEKQTPAPVRLADGKTYSARALRDARKLAYTELARRQDEAALSALLPAVTRRLGVGGFAENGAYVLCGEETPAPWCNIMSNGEVGTVVSESGGGFTFADNARQYKFTEWTNDPVLDPVAEIVALQRDEETWSVTERPFGRGAYGTVHGRGYTEFYSVYLGIEARLAVFIARDESCKAYALTVRNATDAPVTLSAVCALRAVLGDFRRNTLPSLTVSAREDGLYLRCAASGCEGYLHCDMPCVPLGLREEDGAPVFYNELLRSVPFWGVASSLALPAGESATVCFTLSAHAPSAEFNVRAAAEKARLFYERLPRITFDGAYGYLTEWLPYQVYNSRFAARAGFYQVSGAYGFRDQLQDCLALLYCDPSLVRAHILECAAHQFKEGDVQHWWHPPAVGVRTHVCDDRLWLPYAACAYARHTGDESIFDESAPFLCDVPIAPQDASVYTAARSSSVRASLREHCLRAVEASCDFGENGLVRMRGGDWNDAMDKVGERGLGTSVWCSMFLYRVIDDFLPFYKDAAVSDRLRNVSKQLYGAVCAAFGDNRFYRAYTDDGAVLGAPSSPACKIDLLTQSWSVLSGIGSAAQKDAALASAYELLCDSEHKLVKLFDPPFTSPQGIGYIGSYPQGVRENGGQYTQAAVWYVYALMTAGRIERANELLEWLSPAHRSDTPEKARAYCVEPYVSAADVYAGEQAGKGGWTWYTGSASWLYKCLVEQYAGITVRGDVLRFAPHLPASVSELNVCVRYEGACIPIKIVNGNNEGEWRVRIGEVVYNTSSLKLSRNLQNKKIAVVRLP